MGLIVQKYGGSSLATPKHIRQAAERIRQVRLQGHEVVVVVSAMGRMTDHLIALAERTVETPLQREMDMLLTAGERVSMSLLAMALHELGQPAISFTGSQSGILTSSEHSDAKILEIRPTRIREELSKGKVVIIAGFQGVSRDKEITTLGRGGSDTTAVALAAALRADRCEILTDVEGIFSADPRAVPQATLLQEMGIDEALEFSSVGAKMHPRSLEVARKYKVPVIVAKVDSLNGSGTRIGEKKEMQSIEEVKIHGVGTQVDFVLFQVQSKLKDVLPLLKNLNISFKRFHIDSEKIEFLCESEKKSRIQAEFRKKGVFCHEPIEVSLVSLVGQGLCASATFVPDCLEVMLALEIPLLGSALNTQSFTLIVPKGCEKILTQGLHAKWIENKPADTPAGLAPFSDDKTFGVPPVKSLPVLTNVP